MKLNKNAIGIVSAAALAVMAGSVSSQEAKGGNALIRAADGTVLNSIPASALRPADSTRGGQVCIDMTGVESWDGLDDADNITIDTNIGAGNIVVGAAWDVGVATVGASWLSEATVLIASTDGSADPNGLSLSPGAGIDESGDQDFTSDGILDFTDAGLPNLAPTDDGIIRMQFYESFDDNADAVDANWRNAAAPVVCPGILLDLRPAGLPEEATAVPANNPWALALLIAVLAGLGLVAVRRFA